MLSSWMAEASGRENVVKENIRQLEEITRLRQQCESYSELAVNSDERIGQLEEEIIRLKQQLQDLCDHQGDIATHKDEMISYLEEETPNLQVQLVQSECRYLILRLRDTDNSKRAGIWFAQLFLSKLLLLVSCV